MFENYQNLSSNLMESWSINKSHAMIAFSLRGKAHIHQGMPLQDCHAIRTLPNGWSLAVVCDGVGSKPHSDEGSRIAANSFANFMTDFWGSYLDADSVLNLMKSAALYATGEMRCASERSGFPINDYSTTLHAAVYANGLVYWFHSGDGGIIALLEDGTYQLLTTPQKEGEYVIPLLEGPSQWETGKTEIRAQSILLCTDGIYNKIAGKVLRKYGDGIDKGITTFFLNPWSFEGFDNTVENIRRLERVFDDSAEPNDFYPDIAHGIAQGDDDEDLAFAFVRDEIFSDNRPLQSLKNIQDDVTIALIQDTGRKPKKQSMEYFRGPDWTAINQRVSEILYGAR